MKVDAQLRQFFDGLTASPEDAKTFFDDRFDDIDPQKTAQLDEWEEQFGLPPTITDEQERRDRLEGTWSNQGGQDPRYLQALVRSHGFDVYIHDWWDPVFPPLVTRNPNLYLNDGSVAAVDCGDVNTITDCGEVDAECGNTFEPTGVLLVNKIATTTTIFLGCGDPEMECGEVVAACGEPAAIIQGQVPYTIPIDQDEWNHFIYWGDQTFPDIAIVDTARREEFETLLLSICPGEKWLGLLVEYQP